MKISKTHQRFANRVGQDALTNPEPFLGPNYKTVLNFWYYLDTLTEEQWEVVNRHFGAIPDEVYEEFRDSAWEVAGDIVGETYRFAVYMSTRGYALGAACELIAMHRLLGQGKSLVFVPLFDSL